MTPAHCEGNPRMQRDDARLGHIPQPSPVRWLQAVRGGPGGSCQCRLRLSDPKKRGFLARPPLCKLTRCWTAAQPSTRLAGLDACPPLVDPIHMRVLTRLRKFSTALLFATGYKSVDLIRSAWKRLVSLQSGEGGVFSSFGPDEGSPPAGGSCLWRTRSMSVMAMLRQRQQPYGTVILFGHMNAVIARAVVIFRGSPASSDDEIYRKVVGAGVEPKHAARLVEFLPLAYCRSILAGTGPRFSDMFQWRRQNGSLSPERTLGSEPVWTEIMSFAKAEQSRGVTTTDLLAIHRVVPSSTQ